MPLVQINTQHTASCNQAVANLAAIWLKFKKEKKKPFERTLPKGSTVIKNFLSVPANACQSIQSYTGQEGLDSIHRGQDKKSDGNGERDHAQHFENSGSCHSHGRSSSTFLVIGPTSDFHTLISPAIFSSSSSPGWMELEDLVLFRRSRRLSNSASEGL